MAERHKLLLESPNLQEEKFPRRSSKSSSESGYLLSIASMPSHYAASVSSPSNVIDVFDKSTLKGLQTFPGHEIATTSLHTASNLGGIVPKCLLSSGQDGSIKAWDERSNSHSIKMTNLGDSRRELLCCDVSPDGFTVAAGCGLKGEDACVFYWDPRQPATLLRTHSETHSDDVTTVSFSPHRDPTTGHNILLSGSTDGLLCTSNADDDDEDEATIHVGNWGCSISQAGWIQGGSNENPAKIWAASDMETFSTWENDLDQLLSLDIRSPVLHHGRTWVTDYLVTSHSTSTSAPNLCIFTGSNEGDIALLSNMNISVPDAPWCLHKLWTHGHSGIVRGLLWDEENRTLVTGGEDGKINTWPFIPIEEETTADDEDENDDREDDNAMDVSPKPRKRELFEDGQGRGKRIKR